MEAAAGQRVTRSTFVVSSQISSSIDLVEDIGPAHSFQDRKFAPVCFTTDHSRQDDDGTANLDHAPQLFNISVGQCNAAKRPVIL